MIMNEQRSAFMADLMVLIQGGLHLRLVMLLGNLT